MRIVITIGLMFVLSGVQAQSKVLSLENTLDIIRKYHPVARQAKLGVELAEADLLSARGVFDPAFYVSTDRKTFNGSEYFFHTNPELKIPTWFGIDVKAGFENNTGVRVDPETTLGKSTYLGVTIPVLKGLLFDKRRAAILQGKLMVQMSRQEQLLALNDLLYEATEAYWKWVAAYNIYKVLSKATDVNEQRFGFVKKSFLSGDRAAIDTTEALSQWQSIQTMQSQSWYEWQKARLTLGNFLWTQEQQPYDLPEEVQPDSAWMVVAVREYPLPVLDEAMKLAMEQHPKLRAYGIKADALDIEKRAKFQSLLPKLDLNYNFLNKGYGLGKTFTQPLFDNNYKYGVQFGLPLFQREARGDYRMAKIKIQDNILKRDQQQLEIANKVRAGFSEVMALQRQVNLMQDNVRNQQLLLKAEESKFSIGESSMFLVNSRENKLLETQQKYAELRTKFFKSLAGVQWASGTLR